MIMSFEQPQTEINFNEDPYRGGMQQVFANNIGQPVSIEFLIGDGSLVTKVGTIYSVGTKYVTLYQENTQHYIVSDIFSIRFVTFLNTLSEMSQAINRRRF